MRNRDSDPVTRSLCLQQFAPWLPSPVSRAGAEEVFRILNETVRSVFLFRIADGHVKLLEKPAFRVRDTFNDSSEPEPEGRFVYREEFIRATMYRVFFERVLAASRSSIDTLIAIDVNDAPIAGADAPVLAFQKQEGHRTLLIPDIDFLHANFYIPSEYRDETPYESKVARAIFAGSTTGGRTITADDVGNLALPRLRSGVFFKGNDQVDFRLPRIIQCESPKVAEMVAALGVNAEHCSWQEQFGYRFILSMDGNGATCSRVAIALASQSALVKYASPHRLYYFGALVPWRHFIPAEDDTDVVSVVEAERRRPSTFAPVAAEGRDFARRYLGRAGICAYVSELLHLYQSYLSDAGSDHPEPSARSEEAALPLVESGAHIQGIGDVWAWPGEWVGEPGSGRAMEAIVVEPSGVPREAIAYRVVLDDGSLSSLCEGGTFCGTRGENRPLLGLELHVREEWAAALHCRYRARFVDGSTVGPVGSGELCRAASGAALEAVDIVITEAASSAPDAG